MKTTALVACLGFLAVTTAFPASPMDIGRCTIVQMVTNGKECERKFFLSFRAKPKADCNKRFDAMETCVINGIKYCMDGYFKKVYVDSAVKNAMDAYKKYNLRGILCGNVDFPKIPELKGGKGCTKEFYERVNAVTKKFMDEYHKNRGDPALCKKYNTLQQQVVEMIHSNLCSSEVQKTVDEQLKGFISTKFNPFCAAGQKP